MAEEWLKLQSKSEWSGFHLANAEWRIPGDRIKMGETHVVPLTREAVAILRELERLARGGSRPGRLTLARR